MLFTLTQGKSRMVADSQARGYFIVKVNKIVPGNAFFQPTLISQMQTELRDPLSQEYAQEFIGAIGQQMKAKRNDAAINALKARLVSSGS